MKFTLNKKRTLFIILVIAILAFLLYYTREHKLIVDKDTDITVEYNNLIIELTDEEEDEFKDILNTVKIHHSLNRIAGPYHNDSTIFIRIHDAGEDGMVRGVLTICLDDYSKSVFLGGKPNGRFKLKNTDVQKIADLLCPMTISSDT